MQVFYGQHDWDLPPAPQPHTALKERCAVFAAALLAGQVTLKNCAPPSTLAEAAAATASITFNICATLALSVLSVRTQGSGHLHVYTDHDCFLAGAAEHGAAGAALVRTTVDRHPASGPRTAPGRGAACGPRQPSGVC